MQVSQNENSEVVSGVREVSGRAKKSEENGHVSDTLAWESRIADREFPICRTIASLALTSPFILTPGWLLSREWGSLILPVASENIQCSVTSIRAYYAIKEIILSRKSNGNRVRERKLVFALFLFQESRNEPSHRNFVQSQHPQRINITLRPIHVNTY